MSRMRDLLIKKRSKVTPLIHWDFSGKSNADAGTIVEDLTGNGYDLELKNFVFDNESGYNGYPIDFRKTNIVSNLISKSENTITFTRRTNGFSFNIQKANYNNISYVMRVHLSDGVEAVTLSAYVGPNYADYGLSKDRETFTFYEGINIVPAFSSEFFDNCQYVGYAISEVNIDKEATIEIFPLYPDQLVFNNTKAQTVKPVKINTTRGFTAIIRRQFIQEDIKTAVLGQQGVAGYGSDFYIRDYNSSGDQWAVYNLGTINNVPNPTGDLMWSTLSKFFNGQVRNIGRPVNESPDDATLMLGSYAYTSAGKGNFAIREVYIFDRDLTQSQIEKFISDNMIPLPEVYYDVEKQGTLNEHTTKDKLIDFSGNENHGTLHNFTFDESNGWKEGYIQFNADSQTYVSLDTLTKGFKTICMVCEPQNAAKILYDQRANPSNISNPFTVFNNYGTIAYNARNNGGVTYINGVLNTATKSQNLLNTKHCLTIVNNTVTDDNSTTPVIGDRTDLVNDGQYAATMKLYKFLGFKEALSEKQIQMVIEKYNLNV